MPQGLFIILLKQDFQIHEEKTSSRRCHAAAGCRCRNRIRRLRLSEHSELMNANVEALALNETVENAFEVSAICPDCGGEYTDCLHCMEENCGSCTPEEHSCPM